MALIYVTKNLSLETNDAIIRKLDDPESGYAVAVTYPDTEDETEVTELLFTKEEVAEMYDVLFN